ncbi:PemK-like protein [Lactobacillus phage ATCCB]|nr:PemK-like protein [Lactobacillus phage ATCCB]
MEKQHIMRGEVFYANLGNSKECLEKGIHVQAGIRPVLIISNDIGNRYSPIVIVVPITTAHKTSLPTHVYFSQSKIHGTVLCEQILTIPKSHLLNKVSKITTKTMMEIENKLRVSIDL